MAHALVLFLVPTGIVHAHGDWKPRFGGVMNDGGETSFELVPQKTGLIFYVSDHGDPLNLDAGKADLEIHEGKLSRIYRGTVSGSQIQFPGARISRGARLTITLSVPERGLAFGRFSPETIAKVMAGASPSK